jgi:hypothetical protein
MPLALLKRALFVWLLIIVAESIHGTLRTIFLEPFLGSFRARQLSVFTATIIVFTITWFTMRWIRAASQSPSHVNAGSLSTSACLTIGALGVVLTLIFEFGLGRALGMSWVRLLEDYNLAKGGLMLFGLAAMFATPWLVNRYRKDKV